MTPEEKEIGVIMADIGGGTTDIAVFKDGSIYHTSIIPVAGYQFTSDLSIGLGLPFEIAEAMKKKYGNVFPETGSKDEGSTHVEDGHSVSYKDLCNILQRPHGRTLRLILLEMPDTSYASLAPAGLVMTGGGSNEWPGSSCTRAPSAFPPGLESQMGVYGITDVLHDPANATGVACCSGQSRQAGNLHGKQKAEAKPAQ